MIIVCLKGGLGNQMFQYALGRSLSHRLGVELRLDLSWFHGPFTGGTSRKYGLAAFKIQACQATKDDLVRLQVTKRGTLADLVRRLNPVRRKTCIRERHCQFEPSILKLQDDVYLDGYWQSELYFKDIAGMLRGDFNLCQDLDEHLLYLKDQIVGCESVSIHFRRGDYVTNESVMKIHGVCPLAYYHEAVSVIGSKVSRPHFFVFSDDPGWVRETFQMKYPTTFIEEGHAAHEDLYLMSRCRHHIVANSSFSWWGAWLHDDTGDMVITPRQWFKDDTLNKTVHLPERWLRI